MSRHRRDDRPPRAGAGRGARPGTRRRAWAGSASCPLTRNSLLRIVPARSPAGNLSRQSSAEPPGRRSRTPGPSAMAHVRAARWTDRDERARGRRGAAGPDPRTAQSRSARSGGGSSRRILSGIGSHSSRRPREWRTGHHARLRPREHADACGPKSPDSHRVIWGLTSRPQGRRRACFRLPVCPPGSPLRPPSSGSLGSAFSGSFPSAVARCRFPRRSPPDSLSPEQPSR
jgi:hypothetical protein